MLFDLVGKRKFKVSRKVLTLLIKIMTLKFEALNAGYSSKNGFISYLEHSFNYGYKKSFIKLFTD
jgi:hypothetical protein